MENGKGISLGDIGKFRSVIKNLAKDEYKLYVPFQMRCQAEHAKGWGQVVTSLTSAENHFPQMVKMVRIVTKVRQTIKDLGGDMPEDLPAPKKSAKQLGQKLESGE